MTNGCYWLEPSGVCDQLKFNPNQIQNLSLPIKQNSDKLSILIQNRIYCGSLPGRFHTNIFHTHFRDIYNVTT